MSTTINLSAIDLRMYMQSNVIRAVFTKADGSRRVMNATLDPKRIPAEHLVFSSSKKKTQDDIEDDDPAGIRVFDIDVQGWRWLSLDRLISTSVDRQCDTLPTHNELHLCASA